MLKCAERRFFYFLKECRKRLVSFRTRSYRKRIDKHADDTAQICMRPPGSRRAENDLALSAQFR